MRWLRRFVRRNTKPISVDQSHLWKRRLSIAYGILAWNALAVVIYAGYNGRRDWAEFHGIPADKRTPGIIVLLAINKIRSIQWYILFLAQYYTELMDIPKAKVIRISGFKKTEEYDVDNTELFKDVRE